jgi:hypothetical protein
VTARTARPGSPAAVESFAESLAEWLSSFTVPQELAAEMADACEGFRVRIDTLFDRWCDQIRSLLEESRERLRDGVDAARVARFLIATLEGAVLMTRVTREITVMQGIADDLKRFIAMHLREGAGTATSGARIVDESRRSEVLAGSVVS